MKLSLLLSLGLWCAPVAAQTTLGELLDRGAKRLSAEEFRQEVVQKTIVGPSPAGGTIEVVYTPNGVVEGMGTPPPQTGLFSAQINGEWSVGEQGAICTALSMFGPGRPRAGYFTPRCQFWYRLGNDYFFSDSDSDRYAKVLRRSLK